MPDFVRRFFVSCSQISEAYAVRTLRKFEGDCRKIGRKPPGAWAPGGHIIFERIKDKTCSQERFIQIGEVARLFI